MWIVRRSSRLQRINRFTSFLFGCVMVPTAGVDECDHGCVLAAPGGFRSRTSALVRSPKVVVLDGAGTLWRTKTSYIKRVRDWRGVERSFASGLRGSSEKAGRNDHGSFPCSRAIKTSRNVTPKFLRMTGPRWRASCVSAFNLDDRRSINRKGRWSPPDVTLCRKAPLSNSNTCYDDAPRRARRIPKTTELEILATRDA